MGSCIAAVFCPIDLPPPEAAVRLLEFFERELAGYLKTYFASIRRSPDEPGLEPFNETMGLTGKEDLLSRLRREGAGVFDCEVDLGFAPSVAGVAVFSGPAPERKTTVQIAFEKEFTSYLLESDEVPIPFVLSVERMARVIESNCFAVGFYEDRFLPLPPGWLTNIELIGRMPLAIGWRDGIVDASKALDSLGAKPEWLIKTLQGFDLVSLFGRYWQLRKRPGRQL